MRESTLHLASNVLPRYTDTSTRASPRVDSVTPRGLPDMIIQLHRVFNHPSLQRRVRITYLRLAPALAGPGGQGSANPFNVEPTTSQRAAFSIRRPLPPPLRGPRRLLTALANVVHPRPTAQLGGMHGILLPAGLARRVPIYNSSSLPGRARLSSTEFPYIPALLAFRGSLPDRSSVPFCSSLFPIFLFSPGPRFCSGFLFGFLIIYTFSPAYCQHQITTMHLSLLLVSGLVSSIGAAPAFPVVDADAAQPDNIRSISDYFNLLASKVQASRPLAAPPACDLSIVSLPAGK